MELEVRVERARCIGSKTCISAAPGVFYLDLLRIAVVVDPEAASRERVLRAAAECPTKAISVFEGDQQLA
ncbi:MAG: ferredoxin [Acidimicrobiales bacterium]